MLNSDSTRYLLKDVREATMGRYTSEQLTLVLSECGYEKFPENGINDEGFRKLIDRLSEVDHKQARLVRVERKDLGSEVVKEDTKALSKTEINQEKEKKRKALEDFMSNTKENISDFFYNYGPAIRNTLIATLISSALFGLTFGRRIEYNVRYINAVNPIELTQQDVDMRSKFFDFFYVPNGFRGMARTIASANNYFLETKKYGFSTDNAIKILEEMGMKRDYSSRNYIKWASKYMAFLKENGISAEDGFLFLKKGNGDVSSAMNLIKTVQKEGLILR